jgi:uncharacterized membrane protein
MENAVMERKDKVGLLGIVLIGILLRVVFIGQQSFWHDEVVQVRTASFPAAAIIQNQYSYEVLPPVSFLTLHYWMSLGGQSETWVRLLFALIGILTLPVVFLIGRDLFDRKVGLLAALLLAVNPYHIWYSQEARPYIFMICFCAWHVWFFIRSWRAGGRYWAGFFIFALLALYSHPFAALSLGVEFLVAAAGNRNRKFWKYYFGVLVSAGLFYVPYIIHFVVRVSACSAIGNPKELSLIMLGYNLFVWIFGFSVGPSLTELHRHAGLSSYIPALPAVLPLMLVVAVSMGRLLIGAARSISLEHSKRIFILLLWMILIPAALYVFALISAGTFNPRYTSEALIPFLLLLSVSLQGFKQKNVRRFLLVLLLFGSCFSMVRLRTASGYWKEDVRSAGAYLNQNANTSRDLILVGDAYAFTHYYGGSGEVLSWRGAADWQDVGASVWSNFGKYTIKDNAGIFIPGTWRWEDYDRVWVIYFREWMFDADHALTETLEKRFKRVEYRKFPNAELHGFSIQDAQ